MMLCIVGVARRRSVNEMSPSVSQMKLLTSKGNNQDNMWRLVAPAKEKEEIIQGFRVAKKCPRSFIVSHDKV